MKSGLETTLRNVGTALFALGAAFSAGLALNEFYNGRYADIVGFAALTYCCIEGFDYLQWQLNSQ